MDAQRDQDRDSMISNYDIPIIKILILGDQCVGKTSLMLRFTDSSFTENHSTTLGIDFKVKPITHKGSDYMIQIWDSAGQERFRNITRTYYRKSSAIIVAYDTTSSKSFNNIGNWIKNISNEVDSKVPIVIIATKCDIKYEDNFSDKGKCLAKDLKLCFFETSSKTNMNINQVFEYLTKEAIRLMTVDFRDRTSSQLQNYLTEKKKTKCCH
ncbi:hypothetical protein SteCoe_33770 [Stentor coeruleus]|uniref:Uncharacterized protein n=1 Tax=Stentor coeruleus TaxID=5963 RepID=A0A1R2AWD2_9CILI|nr:hypothetical protein SteCoe_33770 [Stentor coeruleus]